MTIAWPQPESPADVAQGDGLHRLNGESEAADDRRSRLLVAGGAQEEVWGRTGGGRTAVSVQQISVCYTFAALEKPTVIEDADKKTRPRGGRSLAPRSARAVHNDCVGDDAIPKVKDSSKLLPLRDPQYRAWQHFLAETHVAGHRYNSKSQSPAANLKYFVTMYDKSGAMMVRTVKDHPSALACCKGLDAYARKMERLFPKLLHAGDNQISPEVVRQLGADLRQRLLRRSEHWKAEAHLRHAALLQQKERVISATALTRRREIVRKYLDAHSMTMAELARRSHTTSPAIYGMIREDRSRFGPDNRFRCEVWDASLVG
jgi:hypothetical protein